MRKRALSGTSDNQWQASSSGGQKSVLMAAIKSSKVGIPSSNWVQGALNLFLLWLNIDLEYPSRETELLRRGVRDRRRNEELMPFSKPS
jgi:hypothetical protein